MKSTIRLFSIIACLYTTLFLVVTNVLYTAYPWVLYCIPLLLLWPLAVAKPDKFGKQSFAWMISILLIVYYLLLNLTIATGHPWVIYVAFAIIWYPFSLYFARKKQLFAFSLFGLFWSIAFFTTINVINSPDTIWAIYPIFAVLWWPLSMYFFVFKKHT